MEHEKLFSIENDIMIFKRQLVADGVSEADIESRVEAERKRLSIQYDNKALSTSKVDTHTRSLAREREGKRLKRALGIKDDHIQGEAFDLEVQERK